MFSGSVRAGTYGFHKNSKDVMELRWLIENCGILVIISYFSNWVLILVAR